MKKGMFILCALTASLLWSCGDSNSSMQESEKNTIMNIEKEENQTETSTETKTTEATVTECTHEWLEATCTSPKKCASCGKIEGEALGHTWIEATCTSPKKCAFCGEIEGEALGHTWIEATYDSPKTCSVCGATEGRPLPKPIAQIELSTPLPYNFDEYFGASETFLYNASVTQMDINVEETNIDKVKVSLSYSGCMNEQGEYASKFVEFYLKIKDENDIVVESRHFYSPQLNVGESFKDSSYFYADLEAGHTYYAYLEH